MLLTFKAIPLNTTITEKNRKAEELEKKLEGAFTKKIDQKNPLHIWVGVGQGVRERGQSYSNKVRRYMKDLATQKGINQRKRKPVTKLEILKSKKLESDHRNQNTNNI